MPALRATALPQHRQQSAPASAGNRLAPVGTPRTPKGASPVPHVTIKHFPRDFTGEQKQQLAEAITTVGLESTSWMPLQN